jgi:hypothetical protein
LTAAQISAVILPLIKEQEGHLKAHIKANQCADEAARKAELTKLVLKWKLPGIPPDAVPKMAAPVCPTALSVSAANTEICNKK